MPTPDTILSGLSATANDWRWLAVGWHLALAVVAGMLVGGWLPSIRTAGWLLIAPLVSVGAVAWLSGNPFNATLFVALAVALARATSRISNAPIRFASPSWIGRGTALVVFGATYPHFLRTDSAAEYLVASPFGLLPCPTLSVVIGATLVFTNLGSRFWTTWLVGAGALYGLIGVVRLGVSLDWGLLVGTAMLATRLLDDRPILGIARRAESTEAPQPRVGPEQEPEGRRV